MTKQAARLAVKSPAVFLVLVGALSLPGCTYVPEVEPTNLGEFREGASARTTVEGILGEPQKSQNTNEGSIHLYVYDRGAEGGVETPDPGGNAVGECILNPLVCLLAIPVYQVGVWAATPFMYANKVDEQEGYLTVKYGTDEKVEWKIVSLTEATFEHAVHAEQGDPQSQYQLGRIVRTNSPSFMPRSYWFCRAARQGHSKAAYEIAQIYRDGEGSTAVDDTSALGWLILASFLFEGEEPSVVQAKYWRPRFGREISDLKSQMTPRQTADAQRFAAEWEPNPAECETFAEQVKN